MKTEKNILLAFLLNFSFAVIECIGGLLTNSIAILSDSIHDLGDSLSIGISYFLEKKSKKKPDNHHTYGYSRYSVIGSVITTTILLVGSIFVIYESIKRILHPQEVNYTGMMLFAILGVMINFIASYVTKEGDSLNQKAVNLHMLEDVLGWVVVLIGSIVMHFTNISLLDPILSIGVAIFILIHAIHTLQTVVNIFLEITPENIDIEELKTKILSVTGILEVHHIHVRSLDGYNHFATLHIVLKEYDEKIKQKVKEELEEQGINHSTIEIELEKEKCMEKECVIKEHSHDHHHHG